jgi:hypothetical protein
MAHARDGITFSSVGGGSSPLSFNTHDLGTGKSRLLIVTWMIYNSSGTTPTNVVCKIGGASGVGGKLAQFLDAQDHWTAAPATKLWGVAFAFWIPDDWTGAKEVYITWTGSIGSNRACAMSWSNVQALRVGCWASSQNRNSTPSDAVWAEATDTAYDIVCQEGVTTHTPGAGQSEWSFTASGNPGFCVSYETGGGAPTTMSWTITSQSYLHFVWTIVPTETILKPYVKIWGEQGISSSLTQNINIWGGNSTRCLVAIILGHKTTGSPATSLTATATIGGTGYPMTKIREHSYASGWSVSGAIFVLANCPEGEGNVTVTVGVSSYTSDNLICFVLENAALDSATIARDSDADGANNGNATSLTLDTSTTDFLFAMCYGASYLRNDDSGQAQIKTYSPGGLGTVRASTKPTTTSPTTAIGYGTATSGYWIHMAASLKVFTGGGDDIPAWIGADTW